MAGEQCYSRSRRGFRKARMIVAMWRAERARWQISRGGGVRSLSVAYFDQCGGLEDDFSVASNRRNWSLPMGTYLHSQRSRVHWASGKWGTVLPEYSTPNCASTASQASRPGKIRTPRNNPDLCAFLSARIERAICDGVLRIGALLSVAPDKCLQTLEFNLIVSPNAPSRALTLRWRRSLRNPIRGFDQATAFRVV